MAYSPVASREQDFHAAPTLPSVSPSASVTIAAASSSPAASQQIYLSWQGLTQVVVEVKNVPPPAISQSSMAPQEAEKLSSAQTGPRKAGCCGGQETTSQDKTLLDNLTGGVRPGQLLAIMGPSGAGKTSLLNALSGRTDPSKLSGEVRYNGLTKEQLGTGQPGAFVEQNDLFYRTLTVYEHLMYQARLRLTGTHAELDARVRQVMQELSLVKARDNRTEVISGGERRRLSFATEILTDPSLLFIDEPTSGLDSFMAMQVMDSLHGLAKRNRTVVCTIHQPDPSIFRLFDLVLIMNAGRCGYFGPVSAMPAAPARSLEAPESKDEAPAAAAAAAAAPQSVGVLDYFAAQGFPRGATDSDAPFLISLFSAPPKPLKVNSAAEIADYDAQVVKATQQVSNFVEHFKQSRLPALRQQVASDREYYKGIADRRTDAQRALSKPYTASWWSQLMTLTSRSIYTLYRDRSILYFRLAQQLFLSLILGMLCFRLDDVQSSVQSRKGAIFFILRFTMFINVLGQLMLFPPEMPIFQREYKAGLYRSDTFFLAKNLAELPGQLLLPILFMSIAYWMIGFADSGFRFGATIGIQILITSAAASLGYFLSTLSTSVRGVAEAGSNILTTLMLFDGFLINASTVPSYMRWLADISIYKWAYEALSIVIWQDFPIGCSVAAGECCTPNVDVCPSYVANGNDVLTQLSFNASDLGFDIAMLFASIVGYRVLSFLFVFTHARRKPVGF